LHENDFTAHDYHRYWNKPRRALGGKNRLEKAEVVRVGRHGGRHGCPELEDVPSSYCCDRQCLRKLGEHDRDELLYFGDGYRTASGAEARYNVLKAAIKDMGDDVCTTGFHIWLGPALATIEWCASLPTTSV
jgi:hypothetical protein